MLERKKLNFFVLTLENTVILEGDQKTIVPKCGKRVQGYNKQLVNKKTVLLSGFCKVCKI